MGSSERLKPEINVGAIQEFRSLLREKMFCVTKNTDRQYTYKWNSKARSHIYFCHGKTICIPFSEYVFVALVVQHATCPVWL
jgi:hypothetical protein